MSSSKKMDSSICDRISGLPCNIIDCILDRLPIFDAVGTSILSKEWIYKWRRVGNLVFDTEFADRLISLISKSELENLLYCYTISRLLLLHIGPIQKFVLEIPRFVDGLPRDLSSWMLFLTNKEVKELTIEAPDTDILRIPSHIFHCSQLQHLKLEACTLDLNIPKSFDGFSNLLSLDLSGTLNGDELSNLIYSCPLLERLMVYLEELEKILIMDAPRLRELSAYCPSFESLQLKNVFSVTEISIQYSYQQSGGLKELMNIVSSVPKVETCTLSVMDYRGVPLDDIPSSLPATLHNLRSLTLLEVNLKYRRCISLLFCIIKSSPNLQKLNLEIVGQGLTKNETALHFLEMQTQKVRDLNNLTSVRIKGLAGDRTEIMLIKIILSSSPVLKTIYLAGSLKLNEEVILLSELLRCPRLSPQAQVVYLKDEESSIFDF